MYDGSLWILENCNVHDWMDGIPKEVPTALYPLGVCKGIALDWEKDIVEDGSYVEMRQPFSSIILPVASNRFRRWTTGVGDFHRLSFFFKCPISF